MPVGPPQKLVAPGLFVGWELALTVWDQPVRWSCSGLPAVVGGPFRVHQGVLSTRAWTGKEKSMSGEFTRRELLRSSVAVGAASTLSANSAHGGNPQSAVRNPQSAKSLKLGLLSYNLAKDWDIDTVIKNCTETGFEHIELRTTHAHGVEVTMSKEQRQAERKRFEA